ncbi:diacylglycerol/lipid kinase family protein [Oceaniglobus trochenteri]|uniref:diacylglycerol/lipid kinase family protein n=1 Tax=Oceaniglobus trochenteri TaxID=2763260 RepID=UPI001CFF744F|nr:diacylglycerol kinase family protein [Oceaniglobus trochenteri]
MPLKKIHVVLNPGSGKKEPVCDADDLRRMLSAQGADVEVSQVRRDRPIGQLVEDALSGGADLVVAAGGDGTICGVAEGMAGSGVAMGVLPLGTFNYFARSLSIPDDIEGAVEVLLKGDARAVRTGRINNRLFLNNTSIGRYPEILANREGIYRRWGRSRIAAYWSVLKTLLTLRRPLDLRIEADDETISMRTPLVFVLNNAFQLDQMGLKGQEDLAEGKLLMFLSPDTGRFGLLRQALALAFGVAEDGRDFRLVSAYRFDIHARRKRHRVALDGERRRLKNPLSIRAVPDELHVVVPKDFDREIR